MEDRRGKDVIDHLISGFRVHGPEGRAEGEAVAMTMPSDRFPHADPTRFSTIIQAVQAAANESPIRSSAAFKLLLQQWCEVGDWPTLDYLLSPNDDLCIKIEPNEYVVDRSYSTSEAFYDLALPLMLQLVLETPTLLDASVQPPASGGRLLLTRRQVLCILAHGLLCTAQQLPTHATFPEFDFRPLFASGNGYQRLQKVFHLFALAATGHVDLSEELAICRAHDADCRDYCREEGEKLCPLTIEADAQPLGARASATSAAQVLFGDAYFGGGVLHKGSGQEESLLCEVPEALAAIVLAEHVGDAQAICVENLLFVPFDEAHLVARGSHAIGRIAALVSLDALPFQYSATLGLEQYGTRDILRELRKAVVGFSGVAMPVVVSAGWGTGTFDGDPELKLLLQWLAASFAGKEQLVYEADRTPVGPNVERVVAAQRAAGASPSAVLVRLMELAAQLGETADGRSIEERMAGPRWLEPLIAAVAIT